MTVSRNSTDIKVRLTEKEESELFKVVWFYLNHPVLAVRDILGLPVSAPHVRIAIREEWKRSHVIKLFSRGMMKSTLDAIMAVLAALFLPGVKVLILGPKFRQGRYTFEDAGIEPIIRCAMGTQDRSALFALNSCVDRLKVISRGSDLWKIRFTNGSQIFTGPVGQTGDTIRGLRSNYTKLDEIKDFSDRAINKVIKPMSNVMMNPMGGEDTQKHNKFTFSGTIGYSDDFYASLIEEYYNKMDPDIDGYDENYCVLEFNYEDAFYIDSTENIKLTPENIDKLLESGIIKFYYHINLSELIKDRESDTVDTEDWYAENKNRALKLGDRYFPYSLVNEVSNVEFVDPGEPFAKYKFPEALDGPKDDFAAFLEPLLSCDQGTIMGVDPARESDKTAITIIRPGVLYGDNFNHLIYAYAQKQIPIKDQAVLIRKLVDQFSVEAIYMDKKGNGVGIMDELVDPDLIKVPGAIPFVDPEYDENQRQMAMNGTGRPILHMLNPTVELNTNSATRLRAAFQKKTFLLPKPAPVLQLDSELERVHKDLQALRGQLVKIKAKPVGHGVKFYMPERKSSDESLERGYKDLFSSLLYAFHGLILRTASENDMSGMALEHVIRIKPFAVHRKNRGIPVIRK